MGSIPAKTKRALEALRSVPDMDSLFAERLVRSLSLDSNVGGQQLLNDPQALVQYASEMNRQIQADFKAQSKKSIGRRPNTEDLALAQTPPKQGILGAGIQGVLDAFYGRAGYSVPGAAENLHDAIDRAGYRQQYSRNPWFVMPEHYKNHGYDQPAKQMAYRTGAMVGAVTGNALRSPLWKAYPADWWTTQSQKFIVNAENGFPVAKTEWIPVPDEKLTGYEVIPRTSPGVRESGAIGAIGAFGSYEAMNLMSGNYNPLNISEGMRPDGYSALSPDENDSRKSTNPALDVVQRYFLSRKGRILPWEQFHNERPEVSYADYTRYKDWQGGKDPNDILNKATLGIMKGTMSGLTGQPEFQMMGVNMTPTGVGAGILTTLGARKLNSVLGNQAKTEFDEFMNVHSKDPASHERLAKSTKPEEQEAYARILRNPFYRHEFRREAKAPHFHVGSVQGLPTIPQPTGTVP